MNIQLFHCGQYVNEIHPVTCYLLAVKITCHLILKLKLKTNL